DVRQPGAALHDAAQTVVKANTYELFALGLTPDTIVHSPDHDERKWRLLPIVPGTRRAQSTILGGRYAPPELTSATDLDVLHPDTYAISWIFVELCKCDFTIPHDVSRLKEYCPYSRLRTL